LLPVTISLDAQIGTPYPRSAGFDTDIGAFIESPSVPLLQGLMASSTRSRVRLFSPDRSLCFGGFALRADSLGHLEQIDSYAPGHQIRFGNLNYMADIRGDLIFDGFGPVSKAPDNHDKHGLDLLPDDARDLNLE